MGSLLACEYADKDGNKCGAEHPVEYDDSAARRAADFGDLKKEDFDELDEDLKKKLEMLNEKLYRHNSKWILTSGKRSADAQHKLHLCRIVSWGTDGIKQARSKSDDEAKKIYDKALALLQELMPSGTTAEQAVEYAKQRRDGIPGKTKGFGENPVSAGKSPCPCGCGSSPSNHLDGKAADGYVEKIRSSSKGIEVSKKSVSDIPLVSKLSAECGLVWGGNWAKVDNIHWQLEE